jgi:hypothetical protein
MLLEIKPYWGVHNLEFNMKREILREKFNHKFTEFKKTPYDQNTTDDFEFCHVYYDDENLCEAIEFFEPSIMVFDGFVMTGQAYDNVKEFFQAIDDSLDFNDAGFTSYKYGIGVYAPDALYNPKKPIEAVNIFRNGYYD